MDERGRYMTGLGIRRAVEGEAHVAQQLEKASELTEEFENLVTRYAWGEVWARPGLARDVRSLITLAMLVAQGREVELESHVRGALNNGVTPDQLKEVLLHAALYCGLPAAQAAFRIVESILSTTREGT